MEFGAIAGALIGLGAAGEEGAEAGAVAGAEALADRQVFDDDQVVAATRFRTTRPRRRADRASLGDSRDAIIRANGIPLIDEWIHPTDLVAAGLKMAEAETQPADRQARARPSQASSAASARRAPCLVRLHLACLHLGVRVGLADELRAAAPAEHDADQDDGEADVERRRDQLLRDGVRRRGRRVGVRVERERVERLVDPTSR